MKIMAIGDIFGRPGRDAVFENLENTDVDFVIANAENAAHGKGLSMPVFNQLSKTKIDIFTLGNHAWGCPDIESVLRYNSNVIRPLNFEGDIPGSGSTVVTAKNGVRIGVINLAGRTYMQAPASSPFFAAENEIETLSKKADLIFVDFHAEATSEKMAMGYFLDGKVTAVFGTHTHVQTADEKILPGGTGYITDLGMTGPSVSILGIDKNIIIDRFLNGMPQKFIPASGSRQFCAAVFDVDEATGKTRDIKRIFEKN